MNNRREAQLGFEPKSLTPKSMLIPPAHLASVLVPELAGAEVREALSVLWHIAGGGTLICLDNLRVEGHCPGPRGGKLWEECAATARSSLVPLASAGTDVRACCLSQLAD